MKHLIMILFFAVNVSAITIRLDNAGVVVDDGLDDSAAINAAVQQTFVAGGGDLIFPAGETEINSRVIAVNSGNYTSLSFRCEKGAFIKVKMQAWDVAFWFGNRNQVAFYDCTFYGDSGGFIDANWVILANYVDHLVIQNCQFLGLGVSAAVIDTNAPTTITDSTFSGVGGTDVIYSGIMQSMIIKNNTFHDYALFRGLYLSKTPGGLRNWIRINGGAGGSWQRRIVIENNTFDEGASPGIHLQNIHFARYAGNAMNVNATKTGAGIFIDNVQLLEVRQSSFGWSTNPRPAIVATNNSKVIVNGIHLEEAVTYGTRDESSQVFFDERTCYKCEVALLP